MHNQQVNAADDLLATVANLRVYKSGDYRAPNKPLLVLLAIAELQRASSRYLRFVEIEERLSRAIRAFRSDGEKSGAGANYPFWYLQFDGIWELPAKASLTRRKGKGQSAEPSAREMRDKDVVGGFTDRVFSLLKADPRLRRTVAQSILDKNFPQRQHQAILDSVGLVFAPSSER